MKSIDFGAFAAKLSRNDLARPNLFKVLFSDVGFNINKDGVIDFSEETIESTGRDNDAPWKDGFDAVRSRVQSKLSSNLLKNSETFKRISGAYSPKLLRMVMGNDIVDGIMGTEPNLNRDVSLMIKSVNIPSIGLNTEKVYTDKKPHSHVTSREQGTVTMTFICSPDMIERQIFQSWMNAIHDPYRNAYSFYNTYAKNFDIYTYGRDGRVKTATHVQDAYPINISEVSLDFDSNNEVTTFTVEFTCSISSSSSNPEVELDTGNIFDEVENTYNEVRNISNNSFGTGLPSI